MKHLFWWLLTAACVAWYSTITVYVAVKGAVDISGMLKRLSGQGDREPDCRPPSDTRDQANDDNT